MKRILAGLGIIVLVGMLAGSTTINGDRTVHDLTITGTCTGCGGGLTVGTSTISNGASGAFLYNNAGVLGNVPIVPGANGGGLVLLQTCTASTSSVCDFSAGGSPGGACFSASYDRYQFVIVNLLPSNDGVTIQAQIKTIAGYDTTSGDYNWNRWGWDNGGGSAAGNTSTTFWQLGATTISNNAAYGGLRATLDVENPNSTTSGKQMFGHTSLVNTSPAYTREEIGALWGPTTAATGIRFQPSAGTFTGNIYCYGSKP